MVTVALAGIAMSMMAFRKELVSAPEEWTFTLRAGWSLTATLIVPTDIDA